MKNLLYYISSFFYIVVICFLITTLLVGFYCYCYHKLNTAFTSLLGKKTLANLFVILYPLVLFVFSIITKKFTILRVSSLLVPLGVSAFLFAFFKILLGLDAPFNFMFFIFYLILPPLFLLKLSTLNFNKNSW
jgi:hypothetical protein